MSTESSSTPAAKRILHVPRRYTALEWGGTETVINEICRVQQQAGWQPEVATSKALDPRSEESISNIPVRRFNYTYPFFGLSASDRELLDKKGGNLFSFSLLNYLMRAQGVRLYHAHTLKRTGGMVRTAARWQKRPYVVSLHGGVFDVPQAELEGLTQPIQNKFEWGRILGALVGSRRVLEDADHIICVGKSEADRARSELEHDRVSYVPNGVDTEKFNHGDGAAFRKKHAIPADAHLTLCLSRLDPQKNQLCLVEAFTQCREQAPGSHLVLIGPPTHPGYVDRIQQAIAASGLSQSIHLIPGLSNTDPDLVNAFHAADLFVLPSLHEPFGIVVLEAWSCRKPVVVSHVGGLKSVVTRDQTGLFFHPDAPNAAAELAERIQTLRSQPELAQRLARAGRQTAEEKYGWHAVNQQLEAIYAQAEAHHSANS